MNDFSFLKVLFLIFVVFAFNSCSDSDDKFQKVYEELLSAHQKYSDTAQLRRAIDSIFVKYDYSKEEFLKAVEEYKRNPERLIEVVDTLLVKTKPKN